MEEDIKCKACSSAHLEPTSIDKMSEIIMQDHNNSYNITHNIDPLTTWLLEKNLDFLCPIITIIINPSINQPIVAFKYNTSTEEGWSQ